MENGKWKMTYPQLATSKLEGRNAKIKTKNRQRYIR